MTDFTIRPHRTIWRHGRTWHRGQEAALAKAGFPPAQKRIKHRNGVIDWAGASQPAEPPGDEAAPVHVPSNDAPADETPSNDAPADETPAGDAPADETPSNDAPADETPSNDAPSSADSPGAISEGETPADETPAAADATEAAVVFAREHSLDLAGLTGTGRGGRIIKRDVEALLKAAKMGGQE